MCHKRTAAAFLVGLTALAACSDLPTPPNEDMAAPRPSFEQIVAQAKDVPAVTMALPPEPRPWDTSDAALAAAVKDEDGHAVIGLKEPASARAFNAAGRRSAVSAATIRGALSALQAMGMEIVELYDKTGAVHVIADSRLAADVRRLPFVDYVEPRQYSHSAGVRLPLLTIRTSIVPQEIPWGISMVRAPQAWTITRGAGVKVEIIDTGHQQGHADWPYVPTVNCSGAYGGCDDTFSYSHGTHVGGIILARDNGYGVVGVAPGVAAADVYVYGACSNDGQCPNTYVAAGINAGIWTVKVMNLSLGGPYDSGIANAVAQAWADDIVIVAAAGNNGGNQVVYPAGYPNVVGVSGVKQDKSFASTSPCGTTSNYGSHVDISAPFWALSTVPVNHYADETEGWCGTSMATPHVSGAAALLRALHPTWTNQQVVDRLLSTALDRGATGRDDYYGYGILDAATAVGYPPPSLSVSISGPSRIRPGATCTWYATVSDGTPPYSYVWTNDGWQVSTQSSYTGGKLGGSASDYFTLVVNVTGSGGLHGYAQKVVQESPTAPICQW